MNRHFLAGASALALLAGASAANAQFTMTIGGDLTVDFGYTELNEPKNATNAAVNPGAKTVEDPRSTDFTQRTRLVFTATQKADSGLSYGTQTRIRIGANRIGGTATDIDADRAFIFVNGGFGQVVIGQHTGFFENVNLRADAWGTGGADGIFPNFVGGVTRTGTGTAIANTFPSGTTAFATLPVSDGSSSRVYYVTPTFEGFRASVGYMPTVGAGDKGRAAQLDENAATYNDVIELGVNYGAAISDVRVDLNAGYVFGSGRPGASGAGGAVVGSNAAGYVDATEDLSAYAVSLRLAFGPAAVSFHYVNAGESGQPKVDTTKDDAVSYMIYGQYTVLPELTIGANYGVYKGPGTTRSIPTANVTTTGVATAGLAGDHELTVWSIGAAYTVAPGLTLRPEYVNYDFQNNEAGGRDYSGNLFFLRTQVSF